MEKSSSGFLSYFVFKRILKVVLKEVGGKPFSLMEEKAIPNKEKKKGKPNIERNPICVSHRWVTPIELIEEGHAVKVDCNSSSSVSVIIKINPLHHVKCNSQRLTFTWGGVFRGKSEQCCMKMWSHFVVELVSLSWSWGWLSDTQEEHKHGRDPRSTITAPHVPSVPFTAGEILS